VNHYTLSQSLRRQTVSFDSRLVKKSQFPLKALDFMMNGIEFSSFVDLT